MLLTAAVVTVKFAEVEPDCTVTEDATVSTELVFDKVTLAPPVGAAWVRVIVQVLEELAPIVVGLQLTAETRTGASRSTVVLAELLL